MGEELENFLMGLVLIGAFVSAPFLFHQIYKESREYHRIKLSSGQEVTCRVECSEGGCLLHSCLNNQPTIHQATNYTDLGVVQ